VGGKRESITPKLESITPQRLVLGVGAPGGKRRGFTKRESSNLEVGD
jgi:hypothetical protein